MVKEIFRFKKNHLRNWIQLVVFMATILIGIQFYLYVHQPFGSETPGIGRPAGVEGFLPIGALMSWKRFFVTGEWDMIHPTAMVIFGFAMGVSFLFRKSFCSWFCPIGTLSEWAWKFGRKVFGRNFHLPIWLDTLLRSMKYLLLGFFVWIIGRMSAEAITMFIHSPYYKISDVKMLRFFTHMSLTTGIVLSILIIGSLFIQNFWCRYFCPYGALTGLLGALGPTRIRRDPKTCTDCGKCSRACPHRIKISEKRAIYSPECTGCMDCVKDCRSNGTLDLYSGVAGKGFFWSRKTFGIVFIAIYSVVITLAIINGYWQSELPESEFRLLLEQIDSPSITHPGL